MFSLIITIISIALVVALVAATMYHGGTALTDGRVKADAAAFVNGAQQISGAASIFTANTGSAPADVAALTTAKLLNGTPVGPQSEAYTLDSTAHTVTSLVTSTLVCAQLEAQGGDIYGCTSVAGAQPTDPAVNTFVYHY